MDGILLDGYYTVFIFFILSSIDGLGTLIPYNENAAENYWCLHHPDSFPLNIYSEMEMLGQMEVLFLDF